MTQGYEEEQDRLKAEVETLEEWVENEEEMDGNMDSFLEVVQRYVDVPELTPTIVNEYIKKIIVYVPDKSSGHRQQKGKSSGTSSMKSISPILKELLFIKDP